MRWCVFLSIHSLTLKLKLHHNLWISDSLESRKSFAIYCDGTHPLFDCTEVKQSTRLIYRCLRVQRSVNHHVRILWRTVIICVTANTDVLVSVIGYRPFRVMFVVVVEATLRNLCRYFHIFSFLSLAKDN